VNCTAARTTRAPSIAEVKPNTGLDTRFILSLKFSLAKIQTVSYTPLKSPAGGRSKKTAGIVEV
jgi:hypothetical protein